MSCLALWLRVVEFLGFTSLEKREIIAFVFFICCAQANTSSVKHIPPQHCSRQISKATHLGQGKSSRSEENKSLITRKPQESHFCLVLWFSQCEHGFKTSALRHIYLHTQDLWEKLMRLISEEHYTKDSNCISKQLKQWKLKGFRLRNTCQTRNIYRYTQQW